MENIPLQEEMRFGANETATHASFLGFVSMFPFYHSHRGRAMIDSRQEFGSFNLI
jgi:hypothetical protein